MGVLAMLLMQAVTVVHGPIWVNRDGSSLWLKLAYVRFAPEAEAVSMSYRRGGA